MTNTKISNWKELSDQHPKLAVIPETLQVASRIRSAEKGEFLYRMHQEPEAIIYVLSGELRLIRHSLKGNEVILQRSQCGFVAEASLDAKTYHCDIIAAQASQLLLFPVAPFRAALVNDVAFNQAWMLLLSREVRRLRAYGERLHLNSASDRILHYLESEGHQGSVILKQSRKAWATELGLSHEVVYRTLKKLQTMGHIRVESNKISLIF